MARQQRIPIIVVSILLCSAVLLSSCASLPSSSPARLAPTAAPQRGGSIVYALAGEPTSLLPQLDQDEIDVEADQAIWAPLWYLDPRGVLHPGLAREVPSLQNGGISADLKTWTIRLRPNLKWSDGSPLTADDLAFSLNTYADVHFPQSGTLPRRDPADPTDFLGATVVDPATVQFTLAHPNVTLLAALEEGTQSIMPREVFGSTKPADILKSSQSFLPTVVSGPFMVKEHVQGDHLTVVRNPHYYQGAAKPYLDQITFIFLHSQTAIMGALQAGAIDAAYGLDFTQLDRYRALAGYTTYLDKYPTSGTELLYFNLTNPILKDLAVRQALTMSLDPRQVIAQAMDGIAVPACDDHVGTFAHEPALTCYAQDTGRAAVLLNQDGWVLAADGFRYKAGHRLELRYSTANADVATHRLRTEALAQAAWGRIGIKLDIENQPGFQFYPAFIKGAYDIAEQFSFGGGYDPDDHTMFMCNQTPDHDGGNYMHYCNPEVDREETVQQLTADVNARKAVFHTIHVAVLADLPLMYLFNPRQVGIYRTTLHNYMPMMMGGGDTWNVWDWYLR